MTDTAVSIGCRKTIEVAGRLGAWLERSDALAAEVKPVIGTAMERATLDLRRVMHSIDFAPCVGVVGGSDVDRLQLATSSLIQPGTTTIHELSDLRHQLHGVHTILEQVAGDDVGAALRFRHVGGRTSAGDGYLFPVQVDLLGTLDIVKIIVAAYYAHVPDAGRTRLHQDDIQQAIDRADKALSTAAVPGISADDIFSLRQHLWTDLPRVDGLRTLSTSGYWEWLAQHIAHLRMDGRCHILSCLWHFNPHFTALFRHLGNALRDLGYAGSVRLPIEALLSTDADSGNATSHPQSIMRQATTAGLLPDAMPAPDIRVAISQGTLRNTNRATIAALAHTVTLRIARAAPFPLEHTDLRIFPSPPPVTDLALRFTTGTAASDDPDADLAGMLFARCKSAYLFSRACSHNEVAAVVLLADAAAPADDTHMRAISDWIELSEGADARARERMENCLAILIKTPTETSGTASTADDGPGPDAPDDIARNRFVAELLGENNRWAREWTPGRPFSQIHFVPGFANPAVIATPPRVNRFAVAAQGGVFPARPPPSITPTQATRVLLEIAANSSQVIRNRQIRRQLATIQRAMQARMFRYHRSNNPAQFTDWRRQIANVATKRLEACADARQLGILLGILTLSEVEAEMLLSGLKGAKAGYQDGAGHAIDITIGRAALPDPDACAEAVVAAWLKLMHEAAGSRHLCRQLNIAQPVFQHMIDEIVIGVHRADLVGTVAAKFVRTLEASNPHSDLARSYAVVAARTLGSFLERLAVAAAQRPPDVKTLSGPSTGPFGDLPVQNVLSTTHPHTERQTAGISQWPALFRRMIDDNIIAAEGLTAHSDADHELGEYLSMLTSNPLEVEL